MKYILFDTNIYLDMIVSREENNTVDNYEHLEKLLDFDKVKIILPKIVKSEVKRNLKNEIENIGNKIKAVRTNLKNTYWLNHIDEIETFNNRLKPLKSELGKLSDEFEKSKLKFIEIAEKKVDVLFSHPNVIEIEENEMLLSNVQKRKIYKKCPFHIDDKDSYADALIIEILVNLKDMINFSLSDSLYFMTRNYRDFSASNKEKDNIHNDIKLELERNNLINMFNYRRNFNKTLIQDFEQEIKEADAKWYEELEEEAKYKEKIYYRDLKNEERESVGLKSLDFDYLEFISMQDEVTDFIYNIHELINDYSANLEEYIIEYDDLIEGLDEIDEERLLKRIKKYNETPIDLKIDVIDDEVDDSIISFVNSNLIDRDKVNYVFENIKSKDYFSRGDIFTFYDFEKNEYSITAKGEINPEDYSTDNIILDFTKNDNKIIEGEIELYYGGIEFNFDGCVDEGAKESITVNLSDIFEEVKKTINKLTGLVTKNRAELNNIEKYLKK